MRRDVNLIRVLAVLGVLAGARGALAQVDIHACALNAGGRLRELAAGAACKRNEHAVTWAQDGPQGPKGDPGPTGGSGPPPCTAIGRLTLPGVTGDGAGGTMVAYAYQVIVTGNSDPAGGPATISALTVTKPLDKASAALFLAAVQGTPFATAKLEVFGPAPPMVATTYDLGTVLISSLAQGSPSRCQTELPTEDVALAFMTITVTSSP